MATDDNAARRATRDREPGKIRKTRPGGRAARDARTSGAHRISRTTHGTCIARDLTTHDLITPAKTTPGKEQRP
ncbi:hypothetical protein [Streptomyces sp. NBC_01716]|uniref:hypothetical protein n=1 Tax=Streptomyces sp. NBC_01716 TaxID=2975917 RepID=UPI002E2FE19F|nr:hypothetical protein [Streptomyces sp. NBC_01716]